jgi:hypothetical protein
MAIVAALDTVVVPLAVNEPTDPEVEYPTPRVDDEPDV